VKKIIEHIRREGHEKGSKKLEMCLDCVAYAPHFQMDVQDWDVDYAVFSYYKVGNLLFNSDLHVSGLFSFANKKV
jgi:selenocysteine lyase/cysteine desulfurase